jgi:hypothetical protein
VLQRLLSTLASKVDLVNTSLHQLNTHPSPLDRTSRPDRQRRRAVSPSLRTLTVVGVTLAETFKAILKINFCQQTIYICSVVPRGHSPPSMAEAKYGWGHTSAALVCLSRFFPSPGVSVSTCSNNWAAL